MPDRLCRLVLAVAGALLLWAAPADAARTITYKAGPYTMAGYNTQFVDEETRAPQIDGYVTRMHAKLVNRRGKPVTIRRGMLHHVFFRNLSVNRMAGHCSARQPEVFYSTGEEDETMQLPPGYGYKLRKGNRWELSAMLMSHQLARKKVWIQYEVRVATEPLERVRPLWLRASGCGSSSSYGVRGGGGEGSLDVRSHRWRMPRSGRIVAAGGHLHAGAVALQARQPDCGDRLLWDNTPRYGPPDALPYVVEPLLHEAGPVFTSFWSSTTGIPVRKGDRIDVHGVYEGEHARGAVMAITHVYLAPERKVPGGCGPLPADARQEPPPPGTRAKAGYMPIPLWKVGTRGEPVRLDEPESRAVEVPDGTTIALGGFAFQPENVIVRQGDTLKWRFADRDVHNLTFASGPRAIAGQSGAKGDRSSTTFEHPGRYQLFCYLHPMTMREQITVLPR